MAARKYPPVEVRFWAKVDRSGGPKACWIWLGPKTPRGYGATSNAGKSVRAHRLSWELTNGPIPGGLYVCHRCDKPQCVNPDHLFVGTHVENMQDCVAKGRTRNQFKGITHCKHGHELTPENTYRKKDGDRNCLTCKRAAGSARYKATAVDGYVCQQSVSGRHSAPQLYAGHINDDGRARALSAKCVYCDQPIARDHDRDPHWRIAA